MKKNPLVPSAQTYPCLITRLPYAKRYKPEAILKMAESVDTRGLICLSIPVHIESPNNGGRLICELEDAGLVIVSICAWKRDRHIVTTRSKRLTNTWEPIAIFSKSKNYVINREFVTKIKKGFEGREGAFDEEEFSTCIGDHWPVRNDRRDRRFLPAGIVLNCGQLSDLQTGDSVFDPYGNVGVRDACKLMNWNYVNGNFKKEKEEKEDGEEDVSGLDGNEQANS